jgi:hypothetical protein
MKKPRAMIRSIEARFHLVDLPEEALRSRRETLRRIELALAEKLLQEQAQGVQE